MESLQGCSKINGSLIIELTDIKSKLECIYKQKIN